MFIEAIGIAARLLATPVSPAVEAHLPQASYMVLGAHVPAPVGYLSFCRRNPDQCDLPSGADSRLSSALGLNIAQGLDLQPNAFVGGEAGSAKTAAPDLQPSAGGLAPSAVLAQEAQGGAVVRITQASWAALNSVNETINAKLRPMSDEQAFGVSNYWTLPIEDEHRAVGNCKHYALEKRKALVDAGLSKDALSLAIVRTGSGELHSVLVVATDHGELVLDNLTGRIKGWKDSRYLWLARQTPGHPLEWVSVTSPS